MSVDQADFDHVVPDASGRAGSSRAQKSAKAAPILATLATRYSARGEEIPSGITLAQRVEFARRLGQPETVAGVLALHDGASELINALGSLIARSGDPQLIDRAQEMISRWNGEFQEVLRMR